MPLHTPPSVAFGPEVIVESFAPVLHAEIEELHALLTRLPRQATYKTFFLPDTTPVQLLGFDASRQRAVILSGGGPIAIASSSSAFSAWYDVTPTATPTPTGVFDGALLLGINGAIELFNQAPVWAFLPPGESSYQNTVGVISESHSIA